MSPPRRPCSAGRRRESSDEDRRGIESFGWALSVAHLGLAEAYAGKNMKRDAVKHYRKYLEIMPDGPDAAVAKSAIERLQ